MPSKINKKYGADIKGILSIENGSMSVEVEDVETPIVLSELFSDFMDKDVKITIAYGEEL